jgi:hypothetical protein
MKLTEELLDIIDTFDENKEPIFDKYKETLNGLNAVIDEIDETLEGNLFYLDKSPNRTRKLYSEFITKRKHYAIFSTVCDAIVEIGFNAGHSALLGLSANSKLIYRGVDANYHSYTKPCYNYLKECFGDRIDVTLEPSDMVMPQILALYPELNGLKVGWIIDGCHDTIMAAVDIENVLTAAKLGDVIMFDDTDLPTLRGLITAYAMSGEIQILYDTGDSVFLKKL